MTVVSAFVTLACALLLAGGCESAESSPGPQTGDDSSTAGAGDGDGDGTSEINALGDECTVDADCPDSPAHLCVFLQSGAPDRGYCSPVCESDFDCAANYTGPETSGFSCFLPSGEPGCTILCESDADCPGALKCQITGGPVNVCATAE